MKTLKKLPANLVRAISVELRYFSICYRGFGGLGVVCWPLAPKFAGSHRAKKILITPSFGGEVKPSAPCRRFAACKISLMA
jgi:hypothetical protein